MLEVIESDGQRGMATGSGRNMKKKSLAPFETHSLNGCTIDMSKGVDLTGLLGGT